MYLEDLVGNHLLSAVDISWGRNQLGVDYQIVRFVLDGFTYKIVEDASDDYRSYVKYIEQTNEVISNNFPPQEVMGSMKENIFMESQDDILQFFDKLSNKIVLEIGTKNYTDYYPMCIFRWTPQNLGINQNN